MYVLGCDPGFSNFGAIVFSLEDMTIREACVIKTEKSKAKVLVSEDNMRRSQEISRTLRGLFPKYSPIAICTEGMSFPQNSDAGTKIALAWGVLADIAAAFSLPVVQISPQAIKKKLCGKRNASKKEVEKAVTRIWPESATTFELFGKDDKKHVVDATAAVICGMDSEVIKMARRMM